MIVQEQEVSHVASESSHPESQSDAPPEVGGVTFPGAELPGIFPGAGLPGVPGAGVGIDAQGNVVFINTEAAEMLGRRGEQVIGQPAADLAVEDDQPALHRALESLLDARRPSVRLKLRYLHPSGQMLWIEQTMWRPDPQTKAPSQPPSGPRVMAMLRDATQEQLTANALREYEDRFRMLFHAAPIGVVVSDLDGHAVEVNRTFCRMLGYEAEELRRMSYEKVTHPEDLAIERALFTAMLDGKRDSYQIEKRYIRKDGQIAWANVTVRMLKSPAGRPAQPIAVVEDVTRQRDTAERLRVAELKLRLVSDAALDAVVMLDDHAVVQHWNLAAQRLFGYEAAEALGRSAVELIVPQAETPEINEQFAELARTGTGPLVGRTHQRMAKRRDGGAFPVELSVSPVRIDGRWWSVAVLRDVTHQKQSEDAASHAAQRAEQMAEQLKQALKDSEEHRLTAERLATRAREAEGARSAFLTDMSHEIRTPMTAVLGYTDILLRGDLSDEDQWHFLQSIRTNGRALLDLVNQLLDQSRIEAGRMDAQTITLAPWEVIEEVDTLMRPRVEAKGLTLTIRYQGPIPESIRTDAMKLRQILVNLVGNAIQFTDEGSIEISCRCVTASDGRLRLAVAVSDTGCGIAPERLATLFNSPPPEVLTETSALPEAPSEDSLDAALEAFPESLLEASPKPSAEELPGAGELPGGPGVGLSISRKLAELLGGELAVQSQLGMGSSFTVTIDPGPLEGVRMVTAPQPRRIESPRIAGRTRSPELHGRVLVAEDTAATALLLEFLLKDMGLTVDIAEDGRKACDKVFDAATHGQPYDLIIMDIHMPRMDGYQATRILRQLNYDVPILAVTARAMPSDRDRCARAGCDDYIAKPLDLDHFAERVRLHIQHPERAKKLRMG